MSEFQEALQYLANYEFDFRVRSYSGRGMFGKTCIAIVGDDINMALVGYALGKWAQVNDEDFEHELSRMRSDSIGLGMVYYWPNVAFALKRWDEGETDEEDEED